MRVEYINPFIESVAEFFSAMLGSRVERKSITKSDGNVEDSHVRALIGMSGAACGTVVLVLSPETGANLVKKFLSMDEAPDDETLRDGVAEAINIIAGNAKSRLPQQPEQAICLSLPTVIRGTGVSIDYPTNSNWIEIPFASDLGNFSLLVAFLTLSQEGLNR